jgi:hypothetical protein
MLKVVALTSSHDELARTVHRPVITDVCAVVSLLVEVVEKTRQESVIKISVHQQRHVEILSQLMPVVVNICGKILHPATREVHCAGVRPYVVRQRSSFGVFDCVFTQACNFHTGSSKSSTMYRAGASREDISEAIMHVFIQETVLDVLVNNVVYTARLGHPVSKHNKGIRRALEQLGLGSVELCMPMEECMFVHGLLLRVQNKEWLAGFGVLDVCNLKVRINICRTGVVNFFFGLAGGVPLQSAPEESLRPVCVALLQTVMRAV